MVIKFICPNGHQLSAPDDRAGKTGKCPKCETAFVVPGLDELNEDEPSDELDTREESAESGTAAAGDRADVIVFLCPNGHKLNGPASLKGRPGQCPHCGAKFVIPGDDDEEEEPLDTASDAVETSGEGAAGPPSSGAMVAPGPAPGVAGATGIPGPPPPPAPPGPEAAGGAPFPPEGPAAEAPLDDDLELVDDGQLIEEVPVIEVIEDVLLEGGHPLAAIVARFCEGDVDSWLLNIGLKDGTSFEANRFSRQLSLGHYAVFAHAGPQDRKSGEEEKQQVTIVAWESIGRIDVQRPTAEPDPLFQ